jgi:hypothetical protein
MTKPIPGVGTLAPLTGEELFRLRLAMARGAFSAFQADLPAQDFRDLMSDLATVSRMAREVEA